MSDFGLLTALRSDQFLLLSKQNASYAPLSRRPCQIYLLSYHRDRILAAAEAAERSHPHLEGDSGLELLTDQVQQHVAEKAASEALKVSQSPERKRQHPRTDLSFSGSHCRRSKWRHFNVVHHHPTSTADGPLSSIS